MSFIHALFSRYPSLQRIYNKRIGIILDSYYIFLPRQVRYIRPRAKTTNPKTILFYPQWPYACYTLYKICYYNGYTITNKPQHADAIVYFEDKTYRKPDALLQALHEKHFVINYNSRDISKKHVDEIHKKVFGYNLSIDPQTYKGKYVKKSDENSLHNYVILDTPQKPQKGYVYQRVVNNEINGEAIDLRLPIFGNKIPVSILKYRPVLSRFDAGNTRATIMKPEDVISPEEYKQILRFCREMNLDCGELDVLRDKDTKKLYIVDVNNTPGGPPLELTKDNLQRAIERMSAAFESEFIHKAKNT